MCRLLLSESARQEDEKKGRDKGVRQAAASEESLVRAGRAVIGSLERVGCSRFVSQLLKEFVVGHEARVNAR